jgi:hypothetical protein
MQTFCTIQQYEAKYGPVADEGVLTECLGDASAQIRVELDKAHIAYDDPDEELADRLMRVCRSMTNRILPSGDDDGIPVGATQVSQTSGPFSQQYTLGTAYSTPRMLDSEKDMLGITHGGKVGWAPMVGSGS